METIFAFLFASVIVGAMVFLVYTFYQLNQMSFLPKWLNPSLKPFIVEKTYKSIDLLSVFEYTDFAAIKDRPFDYFSPQRVIRDEEHKKHVVKDHIRKLVDEMARNGCVEMKEQQSFSDPFRKRIELRVKVYKPDDYDKSDYFVDDELISSP